MDDEPRRFSIDELSDLGGVTRRTVRFYVQRGLLPAPLGVGRGRHYDQSHLDRLLQVKAEQDAGRSLDEICVQSGPAPGGGPPAPAPHAHVSRSAWRRLALAPGIELHVASDIKLPGGARLDELVTWCRRHLSRHTEGED